jgi:hypothetical protein
MRTSTRREPSVARKLDTAEFEAVAVLREIRGRGAYVLIDVDGRRAL